GGLRQEQVFETLDYIGEEALRAGDIIHGVRAMVRSKSSLRVPCDVNRLITDAARLARVDPRLQGLELRLELGAPLAPVLADGVQIQQVLLNLIVNGAEAMERGNGGAADIVVQTAQDESMVCVSVSDQGAGLAPAVEKELFRPFFTTKRGGMGMGLSISRTIIEFHGGRLWFTANQTRGTTFHFALPRA
ncbi:MAG: sensor histidine kinase, partial [Gemmatimonadales bacterium]